MLHRADSRQARTTALDNVEVAPALERLNRARPARPSIANTRRLVRQLGPAEPAPLVTYHAYAHHQGGTGKGQRPHLENEVYFSSAQIGPTYYTLNGTQVHNHGPLDDWMTLTIAPDQERQKQI